MPGAPEFPDPAKRAAAERVVGYFATTRAHMGNGFRSGVARSTVVEIPGANHYLFRSHEAEVLQEIRKFLNRLDRD